MRISAKLRVRRRRLATVALAGALALGVTIAAGLGSAAPTPKKAKAKPVTNYLAYVGGKKGAAKANLSPIAIGFINGQGGPQELPEATTGAQAGARYVNTKLGGVRGHRIELHTCFIAQAEEEGQKCGQQMANDSAVKVILFGAVVTGNQSIYGVLRGRKPVIMSVSASPVDGAQKNTYSYYGDQPHVLGPWGTFGKKFLKAKSAALVFPNQAGANSAAAATRKGLQDAGIRVTAVGYEPNQTDLVGPITAARAQSADILVPMTDFAGCVNFAKAIAQLGITKPVVANPLCTFIPGAAYPGGDFPKWYVGFAQSNTSVKTDADVKAYYTASRTGGLKATDQPKAFAALAFAEVLTVVKFMNEIGPSKISAATIAAKAKAFRGPLIMGPPAVKCGRFKDAPAICNNQTQFYRYLGKGSWKRISGWLTPPK